MDTIETQGVNTVTVNDALYIEKNGDEVYLGCKISPSIIDNNFDDLEDRINRQDSKIDLLSEKISQLAEIVNSLFKIIQG